MEQITFNIAIKATNQQVWDILFGVENYPKWTAIFAEGSSVETDWQKGSRALFHDGKGNGMVARIEDNIPNKFLSIRHLGEMRDGKEDLDQDLGVALENYTLEEKAGYTELKIDLNIPSEWKDYFEKTWPKALDKVKDLAEH